MTFVAARRFDQRIMMIADTKITDERGTLRAGGRANHTHNFVPGRLKAFPINTKISVAYAGLSSRALDVIRGLSRSASNREDLSRALKTLEEGSMDGRTDFLLVSHIDGPQIFKVSNGSVSGDQQSHWIGDSGIASRLRTELENFRLELAPSIAVDFSQEWEEILFVRAWGSLLLKAPTLTNAVGGLPVSVLCSPHGHCFNITAGAYNPEPISFNADGGVNADGQRVDGLYGQYSYSFVEDNRRGAPVLGVWLQESRAAYLYDPLTADEPVLCRVETIDGLSEIVALRAEQLGGVNID
jgi:hypothetical protein